MFENLVVFDFESICVKEETYKEAETTKWIGKHVPISVSVLSNLIPQPIFSSIRILGTLYPLLSVPLKAGQRKANHKRSIRFFEVETAIKIKLSSILE